MPAIARSSAASGGSTSRIPSGIISASDPDAALAEQALELGIQAAGRLDPVALTDLETVASLGGGQLQHDRHVAGERAEHALELVEQLHLDPLGVDHQGQGPGGAHALEDAELEGDQLDVVLALA